MESRKERYASKRAEILALPDDAFDVTGRYVKGSSAYPSESLGSPEKSISYSAKGMPQFSADGEKGKKTPYVLYLKRKRRKLLIKLSAFIVCLALILAIAFLFVF